jgi:hypothetical protein
MIPLMSRAERSESIRALIVSTRPSPVRRYQPARLSYSPTAVVASSSAVRSARTVAGIASSGSARSASASSSAPNPDWRRSATVEGR